MKNLYTILKTHLAVIIVVLCANPCFAQTVSVPAGCRVVVTGIGGTLGTNVSTPPGRVGDGGVVTMPDPSGGGIFTFNPPVATPAITTATWGLLGDISNAATVGTISGVVGNYNGVTQPAAGLTANIITYNKRYRPSTTETINPSWARSKGRVQIGYNQAACSNRTLTFDIFKTFTSSPLTNVPVIVGPNCLKPNTLYTYSVDPIVSDNIDDAIGVDSYYWSGLPTNIFPAGLSQIFYNSSDTSSISFTTGTSITAFILQCCYGRWNPNTGDGGISAINQTIVPNRTTCVSKELIVTPLAPVYTTRPPRCLPTGQSSFTVAYPNPVAGQTYTWTAPNTGWTLSPTATSLTVTLNGNNNPGQLTLTITGSCDPVIINYQINRILATTLGITAVGGGVPVTCIDAATSYSLPQNALLNQTLWTIDTVPPGGTLPAGAPTVVNGTGVGSTCTVTPGTRAGQYSLIATDNNDSRPCSGENTTLIITVRPNNPSFTTTSPTCLLKGTIGITTIQVDTSVAGTPTTGYVWDLTLASGWSITAGSGTATPTFTAGTGTGPVTIKVSNGVSPCNSAQTALVINYSAIIIAFNSGTNFCDQYAVTCGTVNSWVINGTAYSVSGSNFTITGNNLTICGNNGAVTSVSANVTVNGTAAVLISPSLGTHGLRQASLNKKEVMDAVVITPNPNSGTFNINVKDYKAFASATLTDISGKEIATYTLQKGDNKIQNERLAKATYLVVLKIDGKQEARQIIIK